MRPATYEVIVPTGELEGRQDVKETYVLNHLIVPTGELEGRQDKCRMVVFEQRDCTNWGIGRPARLPKQGCCLPRNCTNWGIGRPARLRAGKALLAFPLHRLRNRIIRLARKSAFRWKERLSGDSKAFLNAQIRHPLEGKIEHLRRDADPAHLRLPVERLFARQQIAKTPLVENLIGSVCITNSLARFCR